jgi:hypothetical protein
LSGVLTHDPGVLASEDIRALDRAATVIGHAFLLFVILLGIAFELSY